VLFQKLLEEKTNVWIGLFKDLVGKKICDKELAIRENQHAIVRT
jgi:hypothetical protein